MDEAIAQLIIRGERPIGVNEDAVIHYWLRKAFRMGYEMALSEMYDMSNRKKKYWR